MTNEQNPQMIQISEFVASKQIRLFQSLKKLQFSGQLILETSQKSEWTFYLYLGRIVYATGGIHPVRRWRRNLVAYLPQIASELLEQVNSVNASGLGNLEICWEYDLLCLWFEQNKVSREAATRMIRGVISEILFDITQAGHIAYELKGFEKPLSKQLLLMDAELLIVEGWKQWQAWQGAQVADRSPDLAPIIKHPEQLRSRTSEKTYQALTKLLDGKYTLRDLAVQKKREVLQIARPLMPYIQLGLLELVEVPDLPPPLIPLKPEIPSEETFDLSKPKEKKEILVACVDDSLLICQAMERIITAAGYQYMSENDGLQALAALLERRPDFIFVDLMMPSVNGYEICSQLRQLTCFRNTPIVIFTTNITFLDRLRSKIVGCSELLSKPLDGKTVLSVIAKHLKEAAIK